MDRRTKAAYKAVFRFINENVLSLVGVASFTSDFERAMRNALKDLYPSTKRYTCHFHYCQALKRRAWQTETLLNAIRSDSKCRYTNIYIPFLSCFYRFFFTHRSIYYRLQCLPLLPANRIVQTFRDLRTEAMDVNQSAFRLYFEYMQSQWIEKVRITLIYVIVVVLPVTH